MTTKEIVENIRGILNEEQDFEGNCEIKNCEPFKINCDSAIAALDIVNSLLKQNESFDLKNIHNLIKTEENILNTREKNKSQRKLVFDFDIIK